MKCTLSNSVGQETKKDRTLMEYYLIIVIAGVKVIINFFEERLKSQDYVRPSLLPEQRIEFVS